MGLRFVYPEFLFALAFLAIPVIIHLFNFRRFKRILFTNVRFLKEVKEETTSRSKLKHLLVLASRLLAVAMLVFAFAQPYIPTQTKNKITNNRSISVFVDNSFSMLANGKEGTLLDEAKTKARDIANAYQPSDQFQLLTCDFEPAHQRMVNREEFLDILDQVKISPSVKTVSEIVSRQREALNNSGGAEKSSFIVSDFQESTTDLGNCKADSLIPATLVPVNAGSQNNVYIDSSWFSSPIIQKNTAGELNIRVRNASSSLAENIPVKLTINGVQKSLASVSVPAEGVAITKMSFTINEPGWQEANVSITDFPITFDDQYFFSFEVADQMKLVCINKTNENPYLKALFGAESGFALMNTRLSAIDYSLLLSSNLVILNELPEISTGLADELSKFTRNGGSLVIFPDSNPDMQSYLNFMLSLNMDSYAAINATEDKVARIDTKSDLFADVFEKVPENMDLPLVQKHFEMTSSTKTNKEQILKLLGGASLLSRYSFGKGKVYAFSVPLSSGFSGLPRHAIFVTLMYKIALLSRSSTAMSYVIGQNNTISIGNKLVAGEDVFHLVNSASKTDLIPIHRSDPSGTIIDIPAEVKASGNYKVEYKGITNAIIALNYDRKESELKAYPGEKLNSMTESYRLFNFRTISGETHDLTNSLIEINEGIRLWKWCVIFALGFLLIEIVLLKFLK